MKVQRTPAEEANKRRGYVVRTTGVSPFAHPRARASFRILRAKTCSTRRRIGLCRTRGLIG